jgi:hypothetical protein
MDRGKTSQGRGAKTKTQQYPADLFALGSKSSRMEGGEAKRIGVVHGKPGGSHSFSSRGLIIKRFLHVCIVSVCMSHLVRVIHVSLL